MKQFEYNEICVALHHRFNRLNIIASNDTRDKGQELFVLQG